MHPTVARGSASWRVVSQGRLRRGSRVRNRRAGLREFKCRQDQIAIGDASQCTGKSRVDRVRLPEIVRGLRDTLGGSFVPEVSAFEVETIRRVTAVDPSTALALAAKGGEVAAPADLDDDFVVLARSGEILGEPQPKAACFHSDDRIDLRVEIGTPIEYQLAQFGVP